MLGANAWPERNLYLVRAGVKKKIKDGKAVTFIDIEANLALTATTINLVECSPLFNL